MNELRRALRLALRADAAKRDTSSACYEANQRLKQALFDAKQEFGDEATTVYLNTARDRIHTLWSAGTEGQISSTLRSLAELLGVGR